METIKCYFCDSSATEADSNDLGENYQIKCEGDCPDYRRSGTDWMKSRLMNLLPGERECCRRYIVAKHPNGNFLFTRDNIDKIKIRKYSLPEERKE